MAFSINIDGVTAHVHTGARWAKLTGHSGLTLGSHIFFAGSAPTVSGYLLGHEFCHVLQWRQLGALRFLWTYVRDLIRYGYSTATHPLEHEAFLYGMAHVDVFEPYARSIRGA